MVLSCFLSVLKEFLHCLGQSQKTQLGEPLRLPFKTTQNQGYQLPKHKKRPPPPAHHPGHHRPPPRLSAGCPGRVFLWTTRPCHSARSRRWKGLTRGRALADAEAAGRLRGARVDVCGEKGGGRLFVGGSVTPLKGGLL